MEEDSDEPVAHVENRNRSKEAIPEPENQVDLLIDDVLKKKNIIVLCTVRHSSNDLSENTQPIVYLCHPSSSNIRNITRGHGGEHGAHRVPENYRNNLQSEFLSIC